MTFAEIDDSEESDAPAHLLSEDEEDTVQVFAASVAERAKDHSRAVKKVQPYADVLPDTSDASSEEAIMIPSRLKKRATSGTVAHDEDEDDLTRMAQPVTRNDPYRPTMEIPKQKPKSKRQSRALDKYQVIPDEPAEVRTSRRSVAKKSISYAPSSDIDGNEVLPTKQIEPTPNLPTPQVESRIHEMISPANIPRSAKKQLTGSIEDSQTPLKSSEDRIQVRASSSIDQKPGSEAHQEFSIILRQKANDMDELVSCTAFDSTPSIPSVSIDVVDETVAPRVPSSDEQAQKHNHKGKSKSRAKKRIIDSDDASEAMRSDDDRERRPALKAKKKGKNTTKAIETKQEKVDVKLQVPASLAPDFSASNVVVFKEEEKLIDIVQVEASNDTPVRQENPITGKDEKPVKETKVVNYAATTIIKSFSGPRHRVGLSRRQRVEPLHANVRRDV